MKQTEKWLETIVKMIPDTVSALIIFADASHTKNSSMTDTPETAANMSGSQTDILAWPIDLPIDTLLLDFATFAATQSNAISSIQENQLFTFSLPIKSSDNKVLCQFSIKLSLNNQTKESVVGVIEWASIWLGYLLEQRQAEIANVQKAIDQDTSSLNTLPITRQNTQAAKKSTVAQTLKIQRWKLLLGVGLITLLFLFPVNYRISAPATLKGKIESSVISPFNGFIQTVHVKPGDKVNQAQILASLDETNITLKLGKLQGDYQEKLKMYRGALAKAKRGQAEIHKAQMSQIQANIDLAQQDINNSKLKSLIKGTVIEGDLRDLIGTPINKGDLLFKVAPTDQFRVVLNIQESDIRFIKRGQSANLKLVSLPETVHLITLNQPSPIFSEENNQLIYKVEAHLNIEKNASFSPGMQGIAKIDVGKTALGWYLFHHFSDWIQMHWWNFKP